MAKILGVVGFIIGAIPLLAFIFFSPGIASEGVWGYATLGWGVLTLLFLAMASRANKNYRILVVIQILLLAGILIQTFGNAPLYSGT